MADPDPHRSASASGAGQLARDIPPRDSVNTSEQGCAQRAGSINQSNPTSHTTLVSGHVPSQAAATPVSSSTAQAGLPRSRQSILQHITQLFSSSPTRSPSRPPMPPLQATMAPVHSTTSLQHDSLPFGTPTVVQPHVSAQSVSSCIQPPSCSGGSSGPQLCSPVPATLAPSLRQLPTSQAPDHYGIEEDDDDNHSVLSDATPEAQQNKINLQVILSLLERPPSLLDSQLASLLLQNSNRWGLFGADSHDTTGSSTFMNSTISSFLNATPPSELSAFSDRLHNPSLPTDASSFRDRIDSYFNTSIASSDPSTVRCYAFCSR